MRLDSIGLNGDILRIEFVKQGDRYRHLLSMVDSGIEPHPLCESIEGTADDPWPPSPPLQSLRFETLSDSRQVALLLGMAGRGHWSASIEPVAGEAAFLFDVACRAEAFDGWLGSQYRALSVPRGQATPLEFGLLDATEFPTDLVSTDEAIRIRRVVPQNAIRRTLRWKYRVGLKR